ncbi:hypothetical protein N7539_007155 [Penicillium diatomitis]|uniref:Uncharacterized protein n=1 Tax=Penicillium diatomitis TaxID=2819901 RepID=A0A9W9WUK7_9EURO|nr:uncharacterized protein N7539_007155 [Penicillium diatomitis]KAJ5477011.1 hypothetical protein N7539_007155 [Penicillium diatomitis]
MARSFTKRGLQEEEIQLHPQAKSGSGLESTAVDEAKGKYNPAKRVFSQASVPMYTELEVQTPRLRSVT